MTVFWSLAGIMMLLALAFVLPPLLRERSGMRIDRDTLNTEVTRERLAELELDLESGRIDPALYQAARDDLERELLNDLAGADAAPRSVRSGVWALAVIAIAVPLSATLLYRSIGSERIITLLEQQPPTQTASTAAPQLSVEEMVSKLAARLENEPDNLRGWTMLARSYSILGRYREAVPAYRNILRLGGGNDADTLADFADALASSSDSQFSAETGGLLERALQLDPDHVKALWLAGHWKKQSGDYTAAIAHWEHAASLMPEDSEDKSVILMQINQARQQAGLPPQQAAPAMAALAASDTTAQPADAGGATAAAGGASLQVTVSLDPALKGRAGAEDTVFIYARAASGPPMPLAIARKQVRDLPVTVTLDDSMAMAPGMKMSGFPELTVGARISKSGNAMAQSGDLQGLQTPVRVAENPALEIVIDSTVP
jgi:cytochrome c-type biogenesis protein CcmH